MGQPDAGISQDGPYNLYNKGLTSMSIFTKTVPMTTRMRRFDHLHQNCLPRTL